MLGKIIPPNALNAVANSNQNIATNAIAQTAIPTRTLNSTKRKHHETKRTILDLLARLDKVNP